MRTVVASDIDGTLHTSRRATEGPWPGDVITDRWTTGYAITGQAGWRDWKELCLRKALIPVTGRTPEQYARMAWPGPRPNHVILSGGGVILVDGTAHPDWQDNATSAAEADGWSRSHLRQLLTKRAPGVKFAFPNGSVGLVCVMPQADQASDVAHELLQIAQEQKWLASIQGQKMFLQTPATSKGAALAWLTEYLNLNVVASAGDSGLDVPMLKMTPVRLTPAGSEAHKCASGHTFTALRGHDRSVVEEISYRLLRTLMFT